jgi:hypothetical protein
MNKVLLFIVLLLFTSIFFTVNPPAVHASFFGDFAESIKGFFHIEGRNTLSIESAISFASNGDLNKNGQIDAGDKIKIKYVIKNQTDNNYKNLILNTNLDSQILNTINNIQGTTSVINKNNTITVPYLILSANQQRVISFEAQINYYKDKDQSLSTQAELLDGGNSLVKGSKDEVQIKKMDTDLFKTFTNSK